MSLLNDINTPGIYYAVAYCLSCTFYIHMNVKRLSGWKLWAAHVLFYAAITSFMAATDGIMVIFFFPCVFFYVFLMLLFIKSCCKIDWMTAGYFCARAFVLGEFAASLEWQLFYYGVEEWGLMPKWYVELFFLCISHSFVFLVMYLLERKYRAGYPEVKITGKELWAAAILCIVVFAISNLSYAFKETPFSGQFTMEIFNIRTFVDLAGLAMMYAYHAQLQELSSRLEADFLQNMLHMYYNNYRISEENIELVNRRYHDLKHQIRLLRSELGETRRKEYLDMMEEEIKAYEAQNKTGNKVLDTILTSKSLQCQNKGISLACVAEGEALNFMHPMDLSVLFGNALDNAMESVAKIQDSDKRLIHVSVARQKKFLLIRVENCYEGEITFENEFPATTKNDKHSHGFGLKSMRATVEKYNGSLTVHARDGWFELRILFPL